MHPRAYNNIIIMRYDIFFIPTIRRRRDVIVVFSIIRFKYTVFFSVGIFDNAIRKTAYMTRIGFIINEPISRIRFSLLIRSVRLRGPQSLSVCV